MKRNIKRKKWSTRSRGKERIEEMGTGRVIKKKKRGLLKKITVELNKEAKETETLTASQTN